jgi:tRNA A-37 threonylcarbamoyl transferase component Bud32
VTGVGGTIARRYRLDEVIGRGGMATVYRALDIRLARSVAIKLLRPEIVADPDLSLRFRREAHAASVLRHPNIVACLDMGVDGAEPFLVMELIDGEDLTGRLRRDRVVPAPEAARIAADVAMALGLAHARGVVHRDVKPANILLAWDGRAMITDFGIARIEADAEAAVVGTTLGSVHYFSPEQARGERTTPASDVYGLGLVLFEMLTGRRAWTGDTPTAVALARLDAPTPSARALRGDVPAELDAIVRRALAADPTERYADGTTVGMALADWVRRAAPVVVPVPPRRSGTVRQPAAAPPRHARAARPADLLAPSRRPRLLSSRPRGTIAVGPSIGRVVSVVRGAFVLASAVTVVVGGLFLASLQRPEGDLAAGPVPGASSTAARTARPSRTPRTTSEPATARPTARRPAPPATDPPLAAPTAGPGGLADLCEPSGEACALAPGRYRPSGFSPILAVGVGDGWSALRQYADGIVLERDEGFLSFASGVAWVVRDGEALAVEPSARALLEAFRSTDGLEVLDEDTVRVDGRRATMLDVSPTGGRLALFRTSSDTFHMEAHAVTRLIVLEVRRIALVIVLEGRDDVDLGAFLAYAGPVIDDIRLR